MSSLVQESPNLLAHAPCFEMETDLHMMFEAQSHRARINTPLAIIRPRSGRGSKDILVFALTYSALLVLGRFTNGS